MNDAWITLVGNVVDEPRLRETKNGHKVANFRIASTSRRFDREQERWVDSDTLYVTVTCWRAQGVNVAESLHKGQPVVVHGRYYSREYKSNEQLRTSYELEATAVGHDLSRGTSAFTRVNRSAKPVVLDSDGIPEDASSEWLDLARTVVDPQTGEVLSPAAAGDPEDEGVAALSGV